MDARRRNIPAIYMAALFVLSANGLAQEGRCYNIVNDMALFGDNEKVIRWKSFDECKELCDEEMSFVCLSFDYTPSGTCHLNSANHITDPESYGSHHGSVYGYATEYITNRAFDSVIQNDATEYDNEEGEELHHDVNYLPPGICELMPITREDEPELFDVFEDAVYAAVTDCQSDSIRRVRQMASSEESDEGSGYVSD
ncbi:hypothetical protein LSH36_396g04014 [Paralvinella palmiformis]|uniref:Apple domain-containing protein n=1 Tax=Paralvinella palmiformis TaxID=53620 RepID=A0AAD9N081_9ANNE|nr:hypothetical protein LSH36_396g04014 [Paralvinella palmiformis]